MVVAACRCLVVTVLAIALVLSGMVGRASADESFQALSSGVRWKREAIACRVTSRGALETGFQRVRAGRLVWRSTRAEERAMRAKRLSQKTIRTFQRLTVDALRRCKRANPAPTFQPTPSLQATPQPSPSPSSTPQPSATPSVTLEPSPSPSPTPSASASPSITPSPSPSPSVSPTVSTTPVVTPSATPTPIEVRINVGGPDFVDGSGDVWLSDSAPQFNLFGSSATFQTTAAIVDTDPEMIPLYQTERYGGSFGYQISLPEGIYDVIFHFAELYWTTPNQRVFDVSIEGQILIDDLDIVAEVGALRATTVSKTVQVTDGALSIALAAALDNAKIGAIEVRQRFDDHSGLHVVIDQPGLVVDYDQSGDEVVVLSGAGSHTHEPGRAVVGFNWFRGSTFIGSGESLSTSLPIGNHTISLVITDDDSPPKSLSGSQQIRVEGVTAVSGMLARYFMPSTGSAAGIIDSLPEETSFLGRMSGLAVRSRNGKVEDTPFSGNVVVELTGVVRVDDAGTYQFAVQGPPVHRILLTIGGTQQIVSGPVPLAVGQYPITVRYAVISLTDLPAYVSWSRDGAPFQPLPRRLLTHDQSALQPFLAAVQPSSGPENGGGAVTLQGFAFFPPASVSVIWNGVPLPSSAIQVTPSSIALVAPPGTGVVQVAVQTPNGVSQSLSYTYDSAQVPVSFQKLGVITDVAPVGDILGPTQMAWGPDGLLYLALYSGKIVALNFNDAYQVTAKEVFNGVSGLSNPNALGLAFNPFAPPGAREVYVSHGFVSSFLPCPLTSPMPYRGEVSVLSGTTLGARVSAISGLPNSNHDHAVNGMVFDHRGDLLIAVGGNTNSGVQSCSIGDLPESPFSAAILRARVSDLGFSGAITYRETLSGLINNDQRFGGIVDPVSSRYVDTLARGLRNSFDLTLSTGGGLYATDNGPNLGFGVPSLSANTSGPEVEFDDELLRVVEGSYYGHPNRNRGRRESRENRFVSPLEADVRGVSSGALAIFSPSSNGIEEYRATTFNSALRGQLLIQRFLQNSTGETYRAKLATSGRAVLDTGLIAPQEGLDVLTGPGGAILVSDLIGDSIHIYLPQEGASSTMVAYDIFPWRAPVTGGHQFVIGGKNFSSLASTTVTIGGVAATLTSVSSNRIRGTIPQHLSAPSGLLDVVVTSGGNVSIIPQAFRYLKPRGLGVGSWSIGSSAPLPMGEVAAGVVGGVIYLVGEDGPQTQAFDFVSGTWCSDLSARPFPGHHHAAEVVDGKLYLFGGIGGGSEDKVQIFDPTAGPIGSCGPVGVWSLGAALPFAAGSASTVAIERKVYLAGGINGSGSATQDLAAVYDVTQNSWSSLPSMPAGSGRNHAAAATDGAKMYIFGGRGNGSGGWNEVNLGFDDVIVFDPATNSWSVNSDVGQPVPKLPQRRGGMGKAVFMGGEFYVIGGETLPSGVGQNPSTNTYDRVDVYDPVARAWRLDAPLPTARHGIFPLVHEGKIYVIAGGSGAGGGTPTAVMEILER